MSKLFRHGRVHRQTKTHFSGKGLKGDGGFGDMNVLGETDKLKQYVDGTIVQKPLIQRFGEKVVGLDIRANPQIIKPFSQVKSARVPLSSTSINAGADAVVAHAGKAVGQVKSQVKNLASIFKGRGVENKNNIRLVL
jgi:hypothetical protein